MIPHIIHLCWFGKGKYPKLTENCIKSWKRYLPDYEVMVWNENSFDVESHEYTRIAYQKKKWAFISDYVRLYALEKYGGVYMDTDLEVIRDFSELLKKHEFVSSTLEGGLITAGFIATRAQHPYIVTLKKKYDTGYFQRDDGSIEFSMNPLLFTRIAKEMYGFKISNAGFMEQKNFMIYSIEYFMPYRRSLFGRNPYAHKQYLITKNTYTIHHDMGSWGNESKWCWWKRAIARQIIPREIYLKIKENKYKKLLQ
ncbi:hypothetical protein HMPREF0992_02428 [Lachnospiraceae bacterium 6_1_63FAA]|nr:hypothetical protein HMPREF0992_02428 [Lachnospiraceae bacterium 6_1_63FAA]